MSNVGDAILANILGNEQEARDAINREIIKQAVMRACFCACGSILDQRRAVLIELECHGQTTILGVACPACADRGMPHWQSIVAKGAEDGSPARLIVTDSRPLYKKSKKSVRRAGRPPANKQ